MKKMGFYGWLYKYLSGFIKTIFRIHVYGAENEPAEGGYLACPNHISYLDVLVAAVSVKRQIRFMAKKELFKVPLLGGLIKTLGAFPVDRTGNAVSSIKKTISLLKEGEVVGLFPQGHRFRGKEIESSRSAVKGGAAMTAFRAGVPVLPMYIETKGNKVALFRRINIYIGKPITLEEFAFENGGNEEYDRGAQLIFDRILALKADAPRLLAAAEDTHA
ncbi:MAG: 1-acyl-sn-glycerol-3-phosphate acyltransferase [Clostridia bacterium]|nr:1-acyl-sn-glycerol-3-phosphate acyltransferase [Clostridia bacterium]